MTYIDTTNFENNVAYINNLGCFDISLYQDKIAIIEIQERPEMDEMNKTPPSKLEAIALILVEKGELTMSIDYRSFCIGESMVITLSDKHFIQFISVSDDFRGYIVLCVLDTVSNLINNMQLPFMPGAFTSLMANPVVRLEKEEFTILRGSLERLRSTFNRNKHTLQPELVFHEMAILFIEMSNILHFKDTKEHQKQKISNREQVIVRFLQLLLEHGRTNREVAFYSEKLCITPVYLLRAVKHVVGKSTIKVINEIVVADAMTLLRKPDMTIQDVADAMNFADRTTFSKFFKKNTGKSPGEYKRKR